MLVVGQGIDGRDCAITGKILDITLGIGAEDRPMNHPAQNARRVFDGLAPAVLHFAGRKEEGLSTEFANAHLE